MAHIRKGDALEIYSGRVRANRNGEVEVHINPSSAIRVNPPHTRNDMPEAEKVRRGSHTTPISPYPSEGLISEEPRFKEFTRDNGETGKILSFILSDNTSSIRVVAWGENAEKLKRLKKGDALRIRKVNLKRGINGESEIHINDMESIEVKNTSDSGGTTNRSLRNSPAHTERTQDKIPRKRICELRDENTAEIRGIITRIQSKTPVYRACPKCFRKVSKEGGKWFCPSDHDIVEPTLRVLYSLILDDGTGTIPCTLSGKVGEELLGMKTSEMLPNPDDEASVDSSIFSSILGTEIILVGRCSTNRNLNMAEFRVQKAFKPDPKTEAKMLLEQIKNEFAN
jgi:DNA/RNA endonuclease YhcR with UshA esterase domain